MMMVEDENIQVDKRRCWNAGLAGCVGRWMETMEGHSRLWRLLQKRYTIPPDHPPPMSATNPSPSRPACSVWSDCWSERCTTPGLLGGGWEGQQATFLPSTVTQSQTIFVSVAPLSAAQSTQHLKSRLSPDHSQCVFHSELHMFAQFFQFNNSSSFFTSYIIVFFGCRFLQIEMFFSN